MGGMKFEDEGVELIKELDDIRGAIDLMQNMTSVAERELYSR